MPTPSLILVPARFKTGKLYTPVATTSGGVVLGASGDFNVTRATTATRVNASGNIEVVASGIPRLDYLASGGVVGCPALLVEPSATNLDQNSANFTSYTLTNVSATTVATSNPFVGVTGVTKLTPSAVSGQHRAFISVGLSSSGRISAIVKADGYNFFSLAEGGGLTGQGTIFDLSNGTIATNAGGNPAIRNIGNGWYRCELDATLTGNSGRFFIVRNANSTADYTGDGTSGILFCHKQIETGSVATSPIVTSGASATRNADVISVSGAVSGCIGQTEGTIYAEVDIRNMAKETYILEIDDGVNANRVLLRSLTDNKMRGSIVATTSSGTIGISSATFNAGIIKIAFAYKSGDFALSVNGATALTASGTFTFGASLNRVTLGSVGGGGSQLNDRIRAAALYTTRLTNAELAALTTL